MAAKRKKNSTAKSNRATFVAPTGRLDAETVELAGPVELPVPGDETGADRQLPAPKAGPGPRGGQFTGVGRGRPSQASRRYAFRRS